MPQGKTGDAKKNNGANLGFEEKLWQAADKLRGHMDAAEYKHVVLGLVFLKYISDAFEEHYRQRAYGVDHGRTQSVHHWHCQSPGILRLLPIGIQEVPQPAPLFYSYLFGQLFQ